MCHQRGNILFLILLAVVLFAALSYAVTASLRGGGNDASAEKRQAQAAQLQQYFTLVSNTVGRMHLMGVPLEKIDFRTTLRRDSSDNVIERDNTLCTDESCEVFSLSGGGIDYRSFEPLSSDPTQILGHWSTRLASITNVGTALPELVAVVGYIHPDICQYINETQGVAFPGYRDFTGESNYVYEGDVTAGLVATDARTLGDDVIEESFIGKQFFCIAPSGVPYHEFYFVLRER